MSELWPFQRKQYEFAAHIRDPDSAPAPSGVEDRRMAIYRQLFFNNLSSLLASTFPVLKKISGPARWNGFIRDFMARHQAHTPLFLKVPEEFLDYLQNEREPASDDPPFLLELAHYEWVELALSVAEDFEFDESIDRHGDLLTGVPVISPLAWTLAYRFPVHRIAEEFQPTEAPANPTILVVYRRLNDDLGFLELNPVTARMLELLSDPDGNSAGRVVLEGIAREIDHPDTNVVVQGGHDTLNRMRDLDVILGTRR